jgi:ubiquitin C-terminal hydrolase
MTDSELENKIKLSYLFIELPEILHIHIHRFIWSNEAKDLVKSNKYIQCPRTLDLKNYLDTPLVTDYVLYAVVIHTGKYQSGRYTVELNHQMSDNWISFDDDVVQKISKPIDDTKTGENILSPSPYLLIYIRKDSIKTLFN